MGSLLSDTAACQRTNLGDSGFPDHSRYVISTLCGCGSAPEMRHEIVLACNGLPHASLGVVLRKRTGVHGKDHRKGGRVWHPHGDFSIVVKKAPALVNFLGDPWGCKVTHLHLRSCVVDDETDEATGYPIGR